MSAASKHRADLDGNCWGVDLARGEHAFSDVGPGGQPKWMRFGCQRDPRITCQIALRPQKNGGGASWQFDGNREAPTIHPSVNCEKVCGWHGWIKAGVWSPA